MHLSANKMLEKLFFELSEDENATFPDILDYFHLHGDGSYKIHADHDREELSNMGTISTRLSKNFIQSGYDVKDDENSNSTRRIIDFGATVEKDESITVTMSTRGEKLCKFKFAKIAIMNFYRDHPIQNRYALANCLGRFSKIQNTLCLGGRNEVVDYHAPNEHITYIELVTDPEREWYFYGTTETGDQLEQTADSNKWRYCAFIAAFKAALIACSRATAYTELYHAVCYGTPV